MENRRGTSPRTARCRATGVRATARAVAAGRGRVESPGRVAAALLAGLWLLAWAPRVLAEVGSSDRNVGAPDLETHLRGAVLGGWIVFGASYGLAVAGGIAMASTGEPGGLYLLVPVVGPAIEASRGDVEPWVRAVLASWVLVEAVGAVLLGWGLAASSSRRRVGLAPPSRPRFLSSVYLAPAGPGGSLGSSVVGLF